MNVTNYKKPSVDDFRKALRDKMGNLTKVAQVFHVTRCSIYAWVNSDPEFKKALRDERGQLFDDCLGVGRLLALGVPAYEYRMDANGNAIYDAKGNPQRDMVGWASKPDPNMIRYFLEKLGKKEEGFEGADEDETMSVKNGLTVKAWIMKENEEE